MIPFSQSHKEQLNPRHPTPCHGMAVPPLSFCYVPTHAWVCLWICFVSLVYSSCTNTTLFLWLRLHIWLGKHSPLFLFKIDLAICTLLFLHTNFRIGLSSISKNSSSISIEIALNLLAHLDSFVDSLSYSSQGQEWCHFFFLGYLLSFISILMFFSSRAYASLIKLFDKL